jgi:hypothetical protein
MKKILLVTFIMAAALIIADAFTQEAHTYSSGSPGNYSGSPGDGNLTCANGCHGGTAISQAGIITTDVPAAGYTPGSSYTITLTVSYMTRLRYGFELSAENAAGTSLGTFSHPTTDTRGVAGTHATHTSSGTSAPLGSKTWTLTWTAPAAGSGPVTFYGAFNATNSNNSSSGDQILKSTTTVQEAAGPCQITELTPTAVSPAVCPGSSTNITISGSQTGVSYQLRNNASNSNIGTAQAGNGGTLSFSTGSLTATTTFNILATRSSSCTKLFTNKPTVTVHTPSPAVITPAGSATICDGDSVKLTASAGSSYSWSTGATSAFIYAKNSGTYTVTVTDNNGCTSTSPGVTVTRKAPVVATVTPKGNISFCPGDSVVLTTGNFSSYDWSNGLSAKSITVKSAGNYSVTVRDAANCEGRSQDTAYVTLIPVTQAMITEDGPLMFCKGDSVILTANTGSSYLWSNGAASRSITVKASGVFTVKVTYADGCSSLSLAKTVTLHPDPKPLLNRKGIIQVCSGDSVQLSTTASFASYAWNTGATNRSITVKDAGSYTVSVTDDNGCSGPSADTAFVTIVKQLSPTIRFSPDDSICTGDSVTLSVGTFSSYFWSDNSVKSTLTVGQAGKYSVFVQDNNGCNGFSDTVEIAVLPLPVPFLSSGDTGVCDSLELFTGDFSAYLWSNGITTRSQFVKEARDYFVTVTDAYGCKGTSGTVFINVAQTPQPVISLIGGILQSSHGFGNRWYKDGVFTGGEESSFVPTGDGSYYVTVTEDLVGCLGTSNIIDINSSGINDPSQLPISLFPNPSSGFVNILVAMPGSVSLLDMTGRKVKIFSLNLGLNTIDLRSAETGSYFMQILAGKYFTTIHIQLEK